MSNCKGCESGGKVEHDLSCLADSYMTFTGAHELPEDVRERVRAAFIAGYEWATGKAVKAEEEKRCGTCAHGIKEFPDQQYVRCECPVPFGHASNTMVADYITDCPCWKART